jgi:hypothetical protein
VDARAVRVVGAADLVVEDLAAAAVVVVLAAGSAAEAASAAAAPVAVGKFRADEIAMVKTAVQQALNGLIDDLRATHGDNLASIVLYGAAAADDRNESSPDYNLLIALHRIAPEDLRQAQAPMREWQRLGYPLPVYFTVEELSDAGDVFPIEFHEMARARTVLYGHDPFEFVKLSDDNLRHQTEYELRSKLIQLRRHYIPASISIDNLCDLMSDSLSNFAALFRAVLLLHGQEPPVGKQDCVRATTSLLRLDYAPFGKIFEFQFGDSLPASQKEANELFGAYMFQIEQVVEAVDELHRRGGLR